MRWRHVAKAPLLLALVIAALVAACGVEDEPEATPTTVADLTGVKIAATKDAAVPETPPLNPAATQTAEALAPLRPPDYDPPGASPCLPYFGDAAEREIEIGPEIPSPRCTTVGPEQLLRFTNNTANELSLQLGVYDVVIPPGESRLINAPAGGYLAPGGHVISFPFPPYNVAIEMPADGAP